MLGSRSLGCGKPFFAIGCAAARVSKRLFAAFRVEGLYCGAGACGSFALRGCFRNRPPHGCFAPDPRRRRMCEL